MEKPKVVLLVCCITGGILAGIVRYLMDDEENPFILFMFMFVFMVITGIAGSTIIKKAQ